MSKMSEESVTSAKRPKLSHREETSGSLRGPITPMRTQAPSERRGTSTVDCSPLFQIEHFVLHDGLHLVPITVLPLLFNNGKTLLRSGDEDVLPKVFIVGARISDGGNRRRFVKEHISMWKVVVSRRQAQAKSRHHYLVRTTTKVWISLGRPNPSYVKIYHEITSLAPFLSFVANRHTTEPRLGIKRYIKNAHEWGPGGRKFLAALKQTAEECPLSRDYHDAALKIMIRNFPDLFFRDEPLQEPDDNDFQFFYRSATSTTMAERVASPFDVKDDFLTLQERQNKILHDNDEDPVACVICDDGGDLVYCEGPCHRHFHPTKRAGQASRCEGLGLTVHQVKNMESLFYCKNCEGHQHQCFICGELGNSIDSDDNRAEVICCDVAFCHRFYHPSCVARMLIPNMEVQKKFVCAISDESEPLYCPRHCCSVCGKAEMQKPGILVQCRRCPTAWHRNCLLNSRLSGEREDIAIWTHTGRHFTYCRKHPILKGFFTPSRDHLKFPHASTSNS